MNPAPRERRDCRCPKARHVHGTYLAYLQDDCRCAPCTEAWVAKSTEQRRVKQAQTWGQPDTRPTAFVDAAPTVLRLRALATLGYGCAELAAIAGRYESALMAIRCGTYRTVRRGTESAVAGAFDRLWDTRSTHPRAGQTISRARSHGWLPPLAIDDTIDTPTGLHTIVQFDYADESPTPIDEIAVERAMRGDRVRLTMAERSEAHARLNRMGLSAREIAERLGTTTRTVTRRRAAACRARKVAMRRRAS